MKIQTLSHKEEDYKGGKSGKVRNFRDNISGSNQFSQATEYVRALNAAKMKRIYSKPFVHSFTGHNDHVTTITRSRTELTRAFSGSADGSISVFNLSDREIEASIPLAHNFVLSLASSFNDDFLYSGGRDGLVHCWDIGNANGKRPPIIRTWEPKGTVGALDCSPFSDLVAVGARGLQIYTMEQTLPITSYSWSNAGSNLVSEISSTVFSPSDPSLLAFATWDDPCIVLYDPRIGQGGLRIAISSRSNCIKFNPRRPQRLLSANEDGNLYTFDIRYPESAWAFHADHTAAVTSCDFSPTGQEFVSGSWEGTVRIWDQEGGRSKNVYTAKRMGRVLDVAVTGDSKFCLSGSTDGTVRLWKTKADEKLGNISKPERAAIAYREKLLENWKDVDNVGRIARHQHLPRHLLNARREQYSKLEAKTRKALIKEIEGKGEGPKNPKQNIVLKVSK